MTGHPVPDPHRAEIEIEGRRILLTDVGYTLASSSAILGVGERRWVDVDQARYLTAEARYLTEAAGPATRALGWVLIGTAADAAAGHRNPCLIWRPLPAHPASSNGQPPAEADVGRWATDSISTLAHYVAANFPDANTGANTTAQVVVGLLDELRQRRAESSQVGQLRRAAAYLRRSDDPISGPLADWLESHAHDLDLAFGRTSSVDRPGDLEHATKIAHAILGTQP